MGLRRRDGGEAAVLIVFIPQTFDPLPVVPVAIPVVNKGVRDRCATTTDRTASI